MKSTATASDRNGVLEGVKRMKTLCFGRALFHKLINPTQFCRIMLKSDSSNNPPIHTTFLLPLTAGVCHIFPCFAYYCDCFRNLSGSYIPGKTWHLRDKNYECKK